MEEHNDLFCANIKPFLPSLGSLIVIRSLISHLTKFSPTDFLLISYYRLTNVSLSRNVKPKHFVNLDLCNKPIVSSFMHDDK